MEALCPPEYWNWVEGYSGLTPEAAVNEFSPNWEMRLQSLKAQYGNDFRVTYEITGESVYTAEQVQTIAAAFAERYGIDVSKVTAVMELGYEATISGALDEITEEGDVTVMEYDGKWYEFIYDPEYDMIGFALY